KKIAAEVGMENETDAEKVLFAFLAKYEGLKSEIDGQINHKDNTEEGGLKQFSVQLDEMKKEIENLRKEKAQEIVKHSQFEKDTLVKQALKEGKIIPLSAKEI